MFRDGTSATGATTSVHEYDVSIPVEKGGGMTLEAAGRRIGLRGIWPNLVRTSTLPDGGVDGRLIDGGAGAFTDMEGEDVEGAFVLMDFNSSDRWLSAAYLGAAGVVGVMVVALITNHLKNGFFIFRPGEGYEYVLTLTVVSIALGTLGPGEWSDAELDHHARHFVTVLSNNNGCNCNAPQVLVLPDSGFPAARFLASVKAILAKRPHAPPTWTPTPRSPSAARSSRTSSMAWLIPRRCVPHPTSSTTSPGSP